MKLNNYLIYLNEDEKIHPKRKEAISWIGATPASDVATAALFGGSKYRSALKQGLTKSQALKGMALHSVGGAAASFGLYLGYRLARSFFDKCTKTCGTYGINTPKRQLCMLKCKKGALEKHIEILIKNKKRKEILPLQKQLDQTKRKIVLQQKYLKEKGKK